MERQEVREEWSWTSQSVEDIHRLEEGVEGPIGSNGEGMRSAAIELANEYGHTEIKIMTWVETAWAANWTIGKMRSPGCSLLLFCQTFILYNNLIYSIKMICSNGTTCPI